MTADPGATPVLDRSLAPDLARGGMLLLIALANVHTYLFARTAGVHSYPADPRGADRIVTLVQMLAVDGRAYPLFALLFGYGITQLAWRRADLGLPVGAVESRVRRRGVVLLLIGAVHAVLLFAGDIVGAYGLLAVLMAGVLVAGSDRALLTTAAAGIALSTLLLSLGGLPAADLPRSVADPDPLGAALARVGEWTTGGLFVQAIGVFGAVALGAWAARRRLLDDPARHRPLLVRVAVAGLGGSLLLGLPYALLAAGVGGEPSTGLRVLGAGLHTLGGFGAGAGYAAVFGLLAIRGAGPVGRALAACGRRSLSCYLAQSVAFAALLPAWTLGLGASATVWQATLLGAGVWLTTVAAAAVAERAGHRGPAEILLRRLTYGPGSPERPT